MTHTLPPSTAQPRPAPSQLSSGWVTVILVAAGAAVAQAFGRFTYGVLLPAVRDDLGLSNSVAGLLGTVNVGAYLVGTIAVAAAAARSRLLDVLRVGFVFSTGGLITIAAAQGPLLLALGLFATGVGGAFIWIPSPAIAADAMPAERRPLAVAIMGSGIGVGIVFTGQLSAYMRNRGGDSAWQSVYIIEAAIGLAVFCLILGLVRHTQNRPPARRAGLGGFDVLSRMPGWKALTAAYTFFGFAYLLIIAFLTTRLEDDSGWSAGQASTAFTLVGLAVIAGGPIFISLARRLGIGRVMGAGFTGWVVLALVILPGWSIPTLAASAGIGLLFSAIPGLITVYVVQNTSVDDYGPSYAAATLAFGVAQMLAPQAGGLLADLTGSFTLVFVLSALFAAAGSMSAFALPRTGTSSTGTSSTGTSSTSSQRPMERHE